MTSPAAAVALVLFASGSAPASTWAFHDTTRPVKVVVLAGSIGAWGRSSYVHRLQRVCHRAEFRNLSATGQGAFALRQRFRSEVLDAPVPRVRQDGAERWLVFGGGLNSVGAPARTNRWIRDLFVEAHAHGWRVVGLSLTPWGDPKDRRFRGHAGVKYLRATRQVVDFVLGRSTPGAALGREAAGRTGGADAPWESAELADAVVDLYDSSLRDPTAPLSDLQEVRDALAAEHPRGSPAGEPVAVDDATRRARERREEDAQLLAQARRWELRPELRAFDHIHPNAEGHGRMAATICPRLPATWGCDCAKLGVTLP
jgi:hypothetical protein